MIPLYPVEWIQGTARLQKLTSPLRCQTVYRNWHSPWHDPHLPSCHHLLLHPTGHSTLAEAYMALGVLGNNRTMYKHVHALTHLHSTLPDLPSYPLPPHPAGHSTLAEAYMALGVLGNNRTMYNSGVSTFTATVADHLKWGKGSFATQYGNVSRLPGECSETMRDMYHSQFGLGGLLQAAEIAWQQVRCVVCVSQPVWPWGLAAGGRNRLAAGGTVLAYNPMLK